MTDQGEPADVVYLDISKAFDSVCHRLLIKKMEAMGINPKINRCVEEFLNNRAFRITLGDHHSREGAVKRWVPQGSVPGPLLFLIFTNDLADELTCNHLFFADDVKLIAPRSQQPELRSSIRQAFHWSHCWDLPFNASESHHLSIGGTPDLRISLSEKDAGKSLQKCEQINDLGITVKAAFNPSANVLAAANKARRMLYFIKDYLPVWQRRVSYLYTVLWCDLTSNMPSRQITHTSKRTLTTSRESKGQQRGK